MAESVVEMNEFGCVSDRKSTDSLALQVDKLRVRFRATRALRACAESCRFASFQALSIPMVQVVGRGNYA